MKLDHATRERIKYAAIVEGSRGRLVVAMGITRAELDNGLNNYDVSDDAHAKIQHYLQDTTKEIDR